MLRGLPPLNALRAFEAAGRHESFSRAAEELRVSHSSISRHVRGLEDRLGVQLFRDLPRGLALSAEGARYLAEISPALDAISAATEGLAEAPAGTITVNSDALFAMRWLIPRLSDFEAQHPGIALRLESSRHLADVDRYEADLAIRFVRPGGKYRNAQLISDAPLHPFAAPSLIPAPVRDPSELLQHTLYRDRSTQTWGHWFGLAGVDPKGLREERWRLRANLAFEAMLAGQGVMLISAEVVSHEVAKGRLIKVSDVGFVEGAYFVVTGEGAARRKPVRIFRDWLLETSAAWRS